MSKLFHEMKESIKDEVQKYKDCMENVFQIIDETEHTITVLDDTDGSSREFTINDESCIDKSWIANRIIVTQSAMEQEIAIDKDKVATWIADCISKPFLMTLEHIVFCAEINTDFTELENLGDKWARMLRVNDMPEKGVLGISWHDYQILFINVRNVIESTERIDADVKYSRDERRDEISMGIATTLAHEIKHLAWANPFLMEKDLHAATYIEEDDAEDYARSFLGRGIPCFS